MSRRRKRKRRKDKETEKIAQGKKGWGRGNNSSKEERMGKRRRKLKGETIK